MIYLIVILTTTKLNITFITMTDKNINITEEIVSILFNEKEHEGTVKIISDTTAYSLVFYNDDTSTILHQFTNVNNKNKIQYTKFESKKDPGAKCIMFEKLITIKFDKNSGPAFNAFVENLENINERTNVYVCHPRSGHIKYVGTMKDQKYDGFGTEYYKSGNIKYQGDFSNGMYDGSGTFYADNNNIKIISHTICNGVPTGVGVISYNKKQKKIDLTELISDCQNLNPTSVNFVQSVAEIALDIEEIIDNNTNHKFVLSYLLNEINTLKRRVVELETKHQSWKLF
jgi:antitoxin component YwqK of YwqJK toxin-antitoxin module